MSGPAEYRNGVKVSERHGAGEWTVEKLALLALMPLGLWLSVAAYSLTGATYDEVRAWFAFAPNAILLALTLLVFLLFASLAWKVIIEDYIHRPANKAALLVLSNGVFLILAGLCIFFIGRLALGSAPLPAGLGA